MVKKRRDSPSPPPPSQVSPPSQLSTPAHSSSSSEYDSPPSALPLPSPFAWERDDDDDDDDDVESVFEFSPASLVKSGTEDGKSTAELRQSVCKYPTTMYLNLHKTHFPFIEDVRMYCHSYRCRECGDSLWKKHGC